MTNTDAPGIDADPYDRQADMQPVLPDEAIDRIARYGDTRTVEAGTVLFDVGAQQTEFILVLSGGLAIESVGCHGADRIVEHRRGSFSGEIDMFSNRRAVVRGMVSEGGEMAFLDREQFRRMLAVNADLSETIIRAFILRRMGLIYSERGDIALLGDPDRSATLSLRSFLSRNGHPHRLIDPDEEPGLTRDILAEFDLTPDDLPVVVWNNQKVLKRPTPRAVADLVGLSEPSSATEVYDVAVIGVGPGGLAAAVNAGAEGLSVICVEGTAPGGQAGTSSKIENYPAFPTGISGQALGGRMMLQAQKFGTEIITPRQAVSLDCDARPFTIGLEDGSALRAHAVVVASGAKWRRLGLAGEEGFENAGVYYGATPVEAAMCADEEVVIVGGGNSAGQAAVFLSRRVKAVHILVRGEGLRETMSDYLVKRIDEAANITLHCCTEVVGLEGGEHLEAMTWRDNRDDSETTKDLRHLFVMIGATPNTDWLGDCVKTDRQGFIVTGADLPTDHLVSQQWDVNRMPYTGETSRPGVFAVSDVRSGSVKRVASAVGEGAISAQFLYKVVHEEGHPIWAAEREEAETERA